MMYQSMVTFTLVMSPVLKKVERSKCEKGLNFKIGGKESKDNILPLQRVVIVFLNV